MTQITDRDPGSASLLLQPDPAAQPRAVERQAPASRLPVLGSYGPGGPALPATPEEWTEPRSVRWVCHEHASWLTARVRRRVKDFARVLACRFPTAQDHRLPPGPGWGGARRRSPLGAEARAPTGPPAPASARAL